MSFIKSHNVRSIKVLRFRRWSNKSYSMFCSIKACVNIGVVTIGIIERALAKSCALMLQEVAGVARSCREPYDGESVDTDVCISMTGREYCALLSVENGEGGVCHSYLNNRLQIILSGDEKCFRLRTFLF